VRNCRSANNDCSLSRKEWRYPVFGCSGEFFASSSKRRCRSCDARCSWMLMTNIRALTRTRVTLPQELIRKRDPALSDKQRFL
jgi:hypothetical protein